MPLTLAQKQALKADIIASSDPACEALEASPGNADFAFAVKDLYNAEASPAFVVWKTRTSRQEILQNGFDWTRLDNLSVGKARVWNDIFVDGYISAAKPNVRAGIEAVWVGTAADLAVRAVVYGHCKRNASRVEKLLASGTGTTETPATMGYEGPLSYQDVLDAMQS